MRTIAPQSPSRFALPILVGLLGAFGTFLRLWWSNASVLTSVVWAEDGLFPLCVRKEGLLTCLVDPFAGYFLFLPRAAAGVVAVFPLEQWATVTNLLAAVLAGLLMALATATVLAHCRSWVTACLVGLLPALAPIVGFEAVGVTASIYMPLLFLMALVVALPPQRLSHWWIAAGVLITTLTIPTGIILLVAVWVNFARRSYSWRSAVTISLGGLVGLVGQVVVMAQAEQSRNLAVTWEDFLSWLNTMPTAILTYWPGVTFGESTIFGQFPVAPFSLTGAVVAAAMLIIGVVLAASPRLDLRGPGLLLILGLAVGAVPALTGYASNRYFVVPVLLLGAALLLLVDTSVRSRVTLVMTAITVGLVMLWSPAFPASQWRAMSGPEWQSLVAGVRATCAQDPAANVSLSFSPDWPMPQTILNEPTTNVAKCVEIQ